MKKIIALVGLMGVGKTTIGTKLAKKLGYYFIDSDQEIEDRERKSIPEIFTQNGEKYFREIEEKIIEEITARDEEIILSIGGGGFMSEKTRKILSKTALTIWLHAPIEELLRRVSAKNNRPLLNGKNRRLVLEELAKKRYATYAQADLKFETIKCSHENLTNRIISEINKNHTGLRPSNLQLIQSTNKLMNKKIRVELDERSYEIVIGKNSLGFLSQFLTQKNYSKIFIITDQNVAKLHLAKLQGSLENSELIILPAGEQTKSFANLEKISEEILAKGVDRKSLIIAFGGGVIGDFAGFISSILLRGIDFIQIPTTLLAAVDSSVGGKTAINSKSGKNLIGSFYQPKLVICDLELLKTLSERELRSGYAEVVKYGLIRDKNFFEFLEKNYQKIFTHDEEFLSKIIARSCEMKAEIVGRDERESGDRMLLNFGHTFGHIFETETGYSHELLHGEAVALGMKMAAKMSQNLRLISDKDFIRIASHLENCGFITDHKKIRKNWNEENLISHLAKDKKNEHKNLTFILLKNIGDAFIQKSVDLQEFKKILQS